MTVFGGQRSKANEVWRYRREAFLARSGSVRDRYGGKEVLKAVANINDRIAPELIGRDPFRQAEIDAMPIVLDGTPTRRSLVP
jgi:enolase